MSSRVQEASRCSAACVFLVALIAIALTTQAVSARPLTNQLPIQTSNSAVTEFPKSPPATRSPSRNVGSTTQGFESQTNGRQPTTPISEHALTTELSSSSTVGHHGDADWQGIAGKVERHLQMADGYLQRVMKNLKVSTFENSTSFMFSDQNDQKMLQI